MTSAIFAARPGRQAQTVGGLDSHDRGLRQGVRGARRDGPDKRAGEAPQLGSALVQRFAVQR